MNRTIEMSNDKQHAGIQPRTANDIERHKRNIRTAWVIGLFALLVMLTSIPFWQGLYRIATSAN